MLNNGAGLGRWYIGRAYRRTVTERCDRQTISSARARTDLLGLAYICNNYYVNYNNFNDIRCLNIEYKPYVCYVCYD